jgi:hypothetical protein
LSPCKARGERPPPREAVNARRAHESAPGVERKAGRQFARPIVLGSMLLTSICEPSA